MSTLPAVPGTPPPDLARILGTVASRGLPGAADDLPGAPVAQATWDRLVLAARWHGVTPLLADAVSVGSLATAPEQSSEMAKLARADDERATATEQLLLETVALLDGASVPYRVLHGPALAHLDYALPALRQRVQVDLLVPGDRLDGAVAVLTSAGHTRTIPQRSRGFDRGFGDSVAFRARDGRGITLHRTFDRGPFGLLMRASDLWDASTALAIAGETLHALATEERFLNACFEAALARAQPRLVSLRDVAQLSFEPSLDLERMHGIARAWHCDGVIARAVYLAWGRLHIGESTVLSAWAAYYQPGGEDAKALSLYVDGTQSHITRTLVNLRAIPGVRSKATYARAVMWPSREYCDAIGSSPLARLRFVKRPWRALQA